MEIFKCCILLNFAALHYCSFVLVTPVVIEDWILEHYNISTGGIFVLRINLDENFPGFKNSYRLLGVSDISKGKWRWSKF